MDEKLLAATEIGDAAGLVRLIAAGANVEAKDKEGWTALMRAASMGTTGA